MANTASHPTRIKNPTIISAKEYAQTLTELKKQIQESQVKAALAANKELIKLYWSIGKIIAEKQESSGWGTNAVEQLSYDLRNTFPGMAGFSRTNIFKMEAELEKQEILLEESTKQKEN